MVEMRFAVSDEHYEYLRQLAQRRQVPLDQVLTELIEIDIAWQRILAEDPVRSLFGEVDDRLATDELDRVIYELEAE